MGWLALAVFVLGSTLTFVLRMLIHRRRTGDTGLRLGNGPAWATALFALAPVFMAAGPVAAIWGLDVVRPLDRPVVAGIGFVLAVAGIVGACLAQADMGVSWRFGIDPAERTDLVTTGAFTVVRNPVYTAVLIVGLGLTLMVPNIVSLVAAAFVVLAIQVQVRVVEEPYLARTHGAVYTAYAGRVGRFLPGVGARRSVSRRR
jgi:protein-S-isoprenylcysteine O-methyltransferase Ste14